MVRIHLAIAALITGFSGTSIAQQVIVVESTNPIYWVDSTPIYYPPSYTYPLQPVMQPSPAPMVSQTASPFATNFPMAARVMQLIADPSLLLPNRTPSAWNMPSNRPLIDAAPHLASITFFALSFGASGTLNTVGMFVPTALRLTRVALYGPPIPGTRAETALWIAFPTVARIHHERKYNGGLFHPPLLQRHILPFRRDIGPRCRFQCQ